MGCSMTEGVGCYDLNNMGGYSQYNKMPKPYYDIQFKNFHKLGWPNRLGRKLFTNMHVFVGSDHPHAAQKPIQLEI